MKALSMILVFVGYVLVYASVAKQGKFATDPWATLLFDAYTTSGQAPASTQATPSTPTTPFVSTPPSVAVPPPNTAPPIVRNIFV